MKKFKKRFLTFALMAVVSFASLGLVACDDGDNNGGDGGTPVITATKWSGEVEALPEAVGNVIEISNGEQLAGFAKAVNETTEDFPYNGYTVKLIADINLDNIQWTPIGNNERVQYAFSGLFDGDGHTIYNLKVTATSSSNNGMAGFFGTLLGSVKNLSINYANISSTHYAGAIVAHVTDTAGSLHITNCHVENAEIVSTAELISTEYDNGDKVGGIIGYSASASIENCSVKNTIIKGYRDLGGIVGCVNGDAATEGVELSVQNCSIENVAIIVDNSQNYKGYTLNAEYNVGNFIGRNISTTESNNVGIAVITYPYN